LSLALEFVAAQGAAFTTLQAVWRLSTALAKEAQGGWTQEFQLANHSVAAVELSPSACFPPETVSPDADGIGIFERLDRRVERVRHVHVHTGQPVA
jgi:hypothetical protein